MFEMTDKQFTLTCAGLFLVILTFADTFVNWLLPVAGQ